MLNEEPNEAIKCYLKGCEKTASPRLTAFCCGFHKEKYWKGRPEVKRENRKLGIVEMQKRLKNMGGVGGGNVVR